MNEAISRIVSLFGKQYESSPSYVAINESPIKESLNEEDIGIIYENPQIFFQASKSRIVLTTWIVDHLRQLFEDYGFSDIDISTEAYEYIRSQFKTTAFNKKRFLMLFKCEDNLILSYDNFIDIEQEVISIFNKNVSQENSHPLITHIKIKKPKEKSNIYTDFKNILKDEKTFNVILQRAQGKTLEEVGKLMNVTRERVRQIESLPKNAIERWLSINEKQLLQNICEKNILNKKKLISYLGPDNVNILKYVIQSFNKKSNVKWNYISEIDEIIYDKDNKFYNIANNLINNIEGKTNALSYFIEELNKENYEFMDEKYADKFLKARNFNIINNTAHFGKITIAKAIELAAEDFVPGGIHITDNDELKLFAESIEKKYGIKVTPGKAFSTRIQDILILIDKATYGPPTIVNVDEKIIKEIDAYINNMPNERISYQCIYNEFKKKLNKTSNIDNQYFLHGILRFYEEKYNYKCLRYYICKKDISNTKSKSYFQKLPELLSENGGTMETSEIINAIPEWNEMYIRYALNYYPEVVQWNKNTYINLNSFKFTDKEKEDIKNVLEVALNNKYKYTSSYIIYSSAKEQIPTILSQYNIDDEKKLFNIVQYLFNDLYKFRKPHILDNNKIKDSFSTDDLVRMVAGKSSIINKKDLVKDIVELYGNKNSSLNLSLQRVLSNYTRIGQYIYIRNDKFIVDEETIKDVKTFIKENMIKGTALIPQKVDDYSGLKRIFDTRWSQWLLVAIADKYLPEYVKLPNESNSSIHALSPIVKANSNIKTRDELAKWLLKNDYDGQMENDSIINYLKTVGLYNSKIDITSIRED